MVKVIGDGSDIGKKGVHLGLLVKGAEPSSNGEYETP